MPKATLGPRSKRTGLHRFGGGIGPVVYRISCHGCCYRQTVRQCLADFARGMGSIVPSCAGVRCKSAAASIPLGDVDGSRTVRQRGFGTRESDEQCEYCLWCCCTGRTHSRHFHLDIASIWSGEQLRSGRDSAKSLAGGIAWLSALVLTLVFIKQILLAWLPYGGGFCFGRGQFWFICPVGGPLHRHPAFHWRVAGGTKQHAALDVCDALGAAAACRHDCILQLNLLDLRGHRCGNQHAYRTFGLASLFVHLLLIHLGTWRGFSSEAFNGWGSYLGCFARRQDEHRLLCFRSLTLGCQHASRS